MATEEGAQSSRLGFQLGTDHISFELDETAYPLDAIYGACYLFLERCYVHLTRPKAETVGVRLTSQEAASAEALDALAGEFVNELLSQTLRRSLAQSTTRIREYYTAAALRSATAAPSVDDLLAELESEELLEDPLEIMVPWEEKQGEESADPERAMAESVKFDPSLYVDGAIEAAAAAYAEVAKIEISKGNDGIEAVIQDAGEYDERTIAHAFANHVLHETIAQRNQAALEEA